MAVGRTTTWSKLSVHARVLSIVFGATAVLGGGGVWVAGYPPAAGAVSGLCALALVSSAWSVHGRFSNRLPPGTSRTEKAGRSLAAGYIW